MQLYLCLTGTPSTTCLHFVLWKPSINQVVSQHLGSLGSHVLPDSNAHGLGEAPEPLYAVVFPASELWAHPEHPRDEVVLDLWQSYLEPA